MGTGQQNTQESNNCIPEHDATAEELAQLPVESLVSIILKQRAMIQALQERITKLETELAQLKPAKTSRNSGH